MSHKTVRNESNSGNERPSKLATSITSQKMRTEVKSIIIEKSANIGEGRGSST